MGELPNWVYDMIMALQKWQDEHPKLYAQYAGSNEFQSVEDCGCGALKHVPPAVADQARAMATYLRQVKPCACVDVSQLGDTEPRMLVSRDCPVHGAAA